MIHSVTHDSITHKNFNLTMTLYMDFLKSEARFPTPHRPSFIIFAKMHWAKNFIQGGC